ncbi:restriction endonuclease subunit S [Paenibacillus sp. IB182496]|uniref:Restriction endonuclease subunit S n=1 Tax=Paenibacillus sabuli TaxID=2772509 RepID=A0A927BYE6_9BACL|nr:restriction endonuclease subunit S [Paenibacillus sabuli]MBD2848196.1 restriction endonuclease subunit S [Paenibacillus sabuli]
MSREQSYLRMLETSAKLQLNMALMLEAKALEAEKVRNWVGHHVNPDAFGSQQELLQESMDIHDQLIEVIDGLSKLGQGMSSVMKVVLRHDQEESGDMMGGMEGLFGGDFGMGGDK